MEILSRHFALAAQSVASEALNKRKIMIMICNMKLSNAVLASNKAM